MLTIISLVLLPLLSFVGGMLGLKSDPKESSKKTWIVAILVISTVASITISISRHQSDAAQKKKDEDNIVFLKNTITLVKGNTEDIKNQLMGFLTVIGVATSRVENIKEKGFSAGDVKLLQLGLAGDDLLKTLASQVQVENQKQQTTVVYYAKDVDPSSVNGPTLINSLEQAGFRAVPATMGRRNPTLPTNAIWAADDVPIDEVKFVVYTLMRAGVEIRAIRKFSGFGRKPHQIEIGADSAIVDLPPLTFEKIQATQSLTRDTD